MAAKQPARPASPSAPIKAASSPRQKRLARQQWLLGLGVTLIVLALQATGITRDWEYGLYDVKSRWFDWFNSGPTDQVALVMLDDQSLSTIGMWPWPREVLGIAIDELRRAEASVIALDMLFEEPQRIELRRTPGGEPVEFDNDAAFAAAMKAHGRIVQAASFAYQRPKTAAELAAEERVVQVPFLRVLESLVGDQALTPEDVRQRLLRDTDPFGPHMNALIRKHEAAAAMLMRRDQLSIAVPGMDPASPEPVRRPDANWPFSNEPGMPVPVITQAAGVVASASFGGGDLDGGVRRLPLWIRVRDRLYPTLSVAACAMYLGVPISKFEVTAVGTEIPLPSGGSVRMPTHIAPLNSLREQGRMLGMSYIPWPRGGSGSWERQFSIEDAAGQLVRQEISLGFLLDPPMVIFPSIRKNIADLDRNMEFLGSTYGLIDVASYSPRAREMAQLNPDQPRWRELLAEQRAVWSKAVEEAAALWDMSKDVDPATLNEAERGQMQDLQATISQSPAMVRAIDDGLERARSIREDKVRPRVKNRIVFVGWSATGAIADFVQTSIHPRTPGVHLHAAMANAILASRTSPQFIRNAPWWGDTAVLLALGFLGTVTAMRLGVLTSPVVLIVLCGLWFAFDGWTLWDYGNWFVALGAPLAAAGASWVVVILHRLLVEQLGRKQTEARFRSYVSPDVVDILVNNPGMSSMAPVRRELTIFFSDIASWTTLAERLGTEGIGKFLATYLKEMTDILQANRATIDKYLGDGIMAFWGAPIADPDHARHAVEAVIEMQQALERMNRNGDFGPAGSITVRIGLAAGEVNVGDFGNPPSKSSYTVIGDAANLSARLESANKQFGSLILISDRVKQLMGIELPMRLMGRVIVKGKTEPETLWEPIGSRQPRGERTAAWIDACNAAVEAYIRGDFKASRQLFDQLEQMFDEPVLAELYRHSMDAVEAEGGPPADFDGSIVLKEK